MDVYYNMNFYNEDIYYGQAAKTIKALGLEQAVMRGLNKGNHSKLEAISPNCKYLLFRGTGENSKRVYVYNVKTGDIECCAPLAQNSETESVDEKFRNLFKGKKQNSVEPTYQVGDDGSILVKNALTKDDNENKPDDVLYEVNHNEMNEALNHHTKEKTRAPYILLTEWGTVSFKPNGNKTKVEYLGKSNRTIELDGKVINPVYNPAESTIECKIEGNKENKSLYLNVLGEIENERNYRSSGLAKFYMTGDFENIKDLDYLRDKNFRRGIIQIIEEKFDKKLDDTTKKVVADVNSPDLFGVLFDRLTKALKGFKNAMDDDQLKYWSADAKNEEIRKISEKLNVSLIKLRGLAGVMLGYEAGVGAEGD